MIVAGGGEAKTHAIVGALLAGALNGPITDEGAAISIVKVLEEEGAPSAYRQWGA